MAQLAMDPVPGRVGGGLEPTILIVDDEPLIRMALADYLADRGYRVLEAGSAADAIQVLQSGSNSVDLIFSDVRMPGGMDGIGLADWIRRNRPGLLTILTSGDTKRTEATHRLRREGAFLAKPYDFLLVEAEIRRLTGEGKKRSA